jgi:hypothetical protein
MVEIQKTDIRKRIITEEKGVLIRMTLDDLALLTHFIKCRNKQGECAIAPGGYSTCAKFANEFAETIEQAKVW